MYREKAIYLPQVFEKRDQMMLDRVHGDNNWPAPIRCIKLYIDIK
jgi:hypothetical protein